MEATTFTVTHARHMASKAAADLKRVQRFYGDPSDARIANYETELAELLKASFLSEVTYGYQCNGSWIEPTLRYTPQDLQGMAANDDDPGKIPAGADISNASFGSFLLFVGVFEHDLKCPPRGSPQGKARQISCSA